MAEPQTVRVPFGLCVADGRMYASREVPLGKHCGCICPACKDELIARHELKGHKTPHFSHDSVAGCVKGLETAVHLAAKQLIEQEMLLFLPKVEAKLEKANAFGEVHRRKRVIIEEGLKPLESVRLEVSLGPIRPDLLTVPAGQSEICVEIAVTHFVDDDKLVRVREAGMALVEIDLSAHRKFTWDTLREALLTGSAPREWRYHPEIDAITASWEEELTPILAFIQKEADAAKARQLKAEMAWAAEEQRETEALEHELRARRADNKAAHALAENAKRAEQLKSRTRARRFQSRTEAEKRAILCQAYGRDRLPSILAARVSGGSSFGVQDALVWQATLFGGLIDGAVAKGVSELNKDKAVTWLKERFKVKPEFANAEKIATWYYLVELANRGAVARAREGNFRLKVASLAALEALQAFRRGRVTLQNGLSWATPEAWPSGEAAARIALAHSGSSHLYGDWLLVSSILAAVRTKSISDILSYYAGSSDSTQLLEYWISAGFVVLNLSVDTDRRQAALAGTLRSFATPVVGYLKRS